MKVTETTKTQLDQYDFAWDEDEVVFSKKLNYPTRIGEFLIAFSGLESALNLFVSEIINNRSHELGYQIIKTLSYNAKINLANELCSRNINFIKNKKLKDRREKGLYEIVSKLLELGAFRNKVVHCNWVTLDKKGFVRTKVINDKSNGVEFIKTKMTPKMLSIYSNQCNVFATRIYHFSDKVQENLKN